MTSEFYCNHCGVTSTVTDLKCNADNDAIISNYRRIDKIRQLAPLLRGEIKKKFDVINSKKGFWEQKAEPCYCDDCLGSMANKMGIEVTIFAKPTKYIECPVCGYRRYIY